MVTNFLIITLEAIDSSGANLTFDPHSLQGTFSNVKFHYHQGMVAFLPNAAYGISRIRKHTL
jgi:hypothetical protein